jgi:hypothetical protein
MDAEHVSVLGTAHTTEWQENHWKWSNPMINEKQSELLEGFKSEFEFEGRLSAHGVRKVISSRVLNTGYIKEEVDYVGDLLIDNGADFHIVQHVDLKRYMLDPIAATETVIAGRLDRTEGRMQRDHEYT